MLIGSANIFIKKKVVILVQSICMSGLSSSEQDWD